MCVGGWVVVLVRGCVGAWVRGCGGAVRGDVGDVGDSNILPPAKQQSNVNATEAKLKDKKIKIKNRTN